VFYLLFRHVFDGHHIRLPDFVVSIFKFSQTRRNTRYSHGLHQFLVLRDPMRPVTSSGITYFSSSHFFTGCIQNEKSLACLQKKKESHWPGLSVFLAGAQGRAPNCLSIYSPPASDKDFRLVGDATCSSDRVHAPHACKRMAHIHRTRGPISSTKFI
jgi:hypothetical protein